MNVVGIDLGTTNSMVSLYTKEGPKLIPTPTGAFETPSIVAISKEGELIVGEAARHRLITEPECAASLFKRSMGTEKIFHVGGRELRAEELSALILRSLRADAERETGRPIDLAVISVPAYFNEVQRKATLDAARLAGLPAERLVNEPTAAALAYGIDHEGEEATYLIADLGGGTFDVSILHTYHGIMEIRASAGDIFFGGEDFTDAIATNFLHLLDYDPSTVDRSVKAHLRELAERAKVHLTEHDEVDVYFSTDGRVATLHMTREEFVDITEPLVAKLRMPIQRAMADAGLENADISKVLLVGGATRMPIIRDTLHTLFDREPEGRINPVHVVSLGASIQAGLAARHEALEDVVLTDICPFTLGTEVVMMLTDTDFRDGYFQPIIERNTTVPVSRVQRLRTAKPDQQTVTVNIYQGESPRVEDNVHLGTLTVPLPTRRGQLEDIDIRYTFDVSSILEVEVTVLSTGETFRTVIQGQAQPMSDAEVEERLAKLADLKIHPAQQARNVLVAERLKAAHAFHLGEDREAIRNQIDVFDMAIAKQDPQMIDILRRESIDLLDYLDAQKVA